MPDIYYCGIRRIRRIFFKNHAREKYTKKREKMRKSEIVNYKLKFRKIIVDNANPMC